MQALLAVAWAGMVGCACACVAVHEWRGERKMGRGKEGVELSERKVGKDSADGEVERGGGVPGSVKSARGFV